MERRVCLLYPEKNCDDCGECQRCDLEPGKICDNCMKCLMNDVDYRAIEIDEIVEDEENV